MLTRSESANGRVYPLCLVVAGSLSEYSVVVAPTIKTNVERPKGLRRSMKTIEGLEIRMGRCIAFTSKDSSNVSITHRR